MPVVPAQVGRPPRGHAASVCEEREAVQSSRVGTDRRERLEAHPNHAVGDGTGECECSKRLFTVLGGDQWTLMARVPAVHQVILKGERGRGRIGEMAVDDIALRKGTCTEEHNLRTL